ncbi:Mu transposase C-terminal domain-containing protein [Mycobacteroides abscessus]|uniref:Mu transposase C-terminal domain-containing protein n=1 Tax=Mycobacteroides abscessus TaxID=36809 RepID=UPI0009A7AFB0|nr:Mu transposase C-terminal domain-containing protein [Mycobacteroides abscessus]MDB2197163.1 Mu transposase C-terminal domain-containing protein [Mycobacteroides abscessus subsp. abscessus]MDB2201977.1 Mu transposase C-terminal domain-containing protein [Mycobacteroides abscessus subsp. abscessus]SKI12522.1 integrase family protein [Mycobacteroides abscessus subsp. massiliense]SKM20712.1 integrase family protein [Mycobacteroides abscessus subsp. massiliense]
MKSVRLFDCIEYDSHSWQVVAQEGNTVALKNLMTSRIRKVQIPELLGDPSYLPDLPTRLPDLDQVAVLETLDSSARDRAEFLHRHVVELLTGRTPSDGEGEGTARPEYDPRHPLFKRIATKVAELNADGFAMSARTLRRHVEAYRRDGVAGLVDGRKTRISSPTGRLDPRLVSLLEDALASQTNISTGTRSRVIAVVAREARALGLAVPSKTTIYEALNNLQRSHHPFGNATTRRTQSNRPDRTWGRQAPARPGELIEIDSTPLDLMVVFPDGSTGRVDLTVALDIATRTPCATVVRPVATKGVDAALLLARTLTPLSAQPGWEASIALSRSVLPPGTVLDHDALAAAIARKPVIIPETVTVDRGKIYVGTTFLNACERLQISVIKAAPRTPTDKPHIERVFAAINTGFTQHLAGYTGPNVVQRGKTPDQEAFWTLAEVQNLLDIWIAATWQNKPHPGLRHPAMPKKDLSPNEAFAALSGVAPKPHAVLDRDDYIALLPVSYRSIQPYGINFEGLHYDSPELHPYRGVRSGLPEPAHGRWEVRIDPYRLQAVYVRDHHRGRWIEAQWTLAKQTLAPFSLDVLRAARRATEGRDAPAIDILAEINRIQTSGARTIRERKAAKRDSVNEPIIAALHLRQPQEIDDPAPPVTAPPLPAAAASSPRRRPARRIDQDEEY